MSKVVVTGRVGGQVVWVNGIPVRPGEVQTIDRAVAINHPKDIQILKDSVPEVEVPKPQPKPLPQEVVARVQQAPNGRLEKGGEKR